MPVGAALAAPLPFVPSIVEGRAASAVLRDTSLDFARDEREGGAGESGLTLVEMLVVLAIIGVMAGATVLGIGAATRAPSAESEARRFAATLQHAADDAMIIDRPLALVWDARGYHVSGAGGEAAQRHALPGGLRIAVAPIAATPVAGPPPAALPLSIAGSGLPFAARLTSATDTWLIGYDGLKAVATRVPTG